MLNYDFSPFYRSTIGFDRLLSLLDKSAGLESSAPAYPPYNIERTGENAYRITLGGRRLRRKANSPSRPARTR